jgi:hypothetical protein
MARDRRRRDRGDRRVHEIQYIRDQDDREHARVQLLSASDIYIERGCARIEHGRQTPHRQRLGTLLGEDYNAASTIASRLNAPPGVAAAEAENTPEAVESVLLQLVLRATDAGDARDASSVGSGRLCFASVEERSARRARTFWTLATMYRYGVGLI